MPAVIGLPRSSPASGFDSSLAKESWNASLDLSDAEIAKNRAMLPAITARRTTPLAIAHLRCTASKCSTLFQRLLRQAQALPFAPRTNAMTTFTSGTNISSAMKVLLPMPQIQLSRNAPQFQRSIPAGTGAAAPWPDVFSMVSSLSRASGGRCQSTRVLTSLAQVLRTSAPVGS